MSKLCDNCGKSNDDKALYCQFCGQQLSGETEKVKDSVPSQGNQSTAKQPIQPEYQKSEGEKPSYASSSDGFKSLLTFDQMISPKIIQIIYFFGLLVILFASLFQIFQGDLGIISGLLTLVLGSLWVRIVCEGLIVIFRINENLASLKDHFVNKG